MRTLTRIKTRVFLALMLTLGLLLAGCGGSDSDGSASFQTGANTGTVAIVVTDNPTSDFAAIEVTINRIELLAADGERAELFSSPEGETVDLLQLENFSRLLSVSQDVPAKTFEKIRLTLSKLTLIPKDQNANGIDVKLPGNGKLDLNPRMTFTVAPGSTLIVQLDVDANKSIHIVQTGNGGYQFRPVVFVKILGAGQLGKLVRVRGIINEPMEDATGDQMFILCPAGVSPIADSDRPRRRCIKVNVLANTSIFDSNADPAAFSDLKHGDEATVLGQLRKNSDRLMLDAAVVQVGPRGTFTNLTGTVNTAPANNMDSFGFTIDPTQSGIPAGTQIQVQLQDQTKVFSKQGDELDFQAIQAGLFAMIDGVLLLSNTDPDTLKSTLVVLDLLPQRLVKLSGTIVGDIDAVNRQFLLETAAGAQACVSVPKDANILRITASGSGLTSEKVGFDTLAFGQDVGVFGSVREGDCLVADTIVIFIAQ